MSKHAQSTGSGPAQVPDWSQLNPAEHETYRNYLYSRLIARQERALRQDPAKNQMQGVDWEGKPFSVKIPELAWVEPRVAKIRQS